MQTKDNVLNILYDNSEKYISGERIAAKLNISRNAVWKAVKQLKSEGYDIAASTNRGYKLLHTHDIFTAQSVCSYLKGEAERKCNIEVLKSVGSTNTLLKEQAECGASEGKVITVSYTHLDVYKRQVNNSSRMRIVIVKAVHQAAVIH